MSGSRVTTLDKCAKVFRTGYRSVRQGLNGATVEPGCDLGHMGVLGLFELHEDA